MQISSRSEVAGAERTGRGGVLKRSFLRRMSVLDKAGLDQHRRYVHVLSASVSTPSILVLDVARARLKQKKREMIVTDMKNEISSD